MDSNHCSGYYTMDGQWTNGFSCGAKQFCCVLPSDKSCCNVADRDVCCAGQSENRGEALSKQQNTVNSMKRNGFNADSTYANRNQLSHPTSPRSTGELTDADNLNFLSPKWSKPVFSEVVVIGVAVGSIMIVLVCSVVIAAIAAWRKRKRFALDKNVRSVSDATINRTQQVHGQGQGQGRSHLEQKQVLHQQQLEQSKLRSMPIIGSQTNRETYVLRQPSAQSVSDDQYMLDLLPPPPENFRSYDPAPLPTIRESSGSGTVEPSQSTDKKYTSMAEQEATGNTQGRVAAYNSLARRPQHLSGLNPTIGSDCNLTEVSSITFNSDVIVWVPPSQRLRVLETCIL